MFSPLRIAMPIWIAAALAMLLTACAGTTQPFSLRTDVDALTTDAALAKRHFMILSADSNISAQDLQFIEFKNYVEKALAKRGFIKVDNRQAADLALLLNYAVSGPQPYHYSYEVPVWSDMGFYPFYRRYRYYATMPTYMPRTETHMLYKSQLSLEAYDMAAYLKKDAPQQLWKINVQSLSVSHDLRATLPYMVTAMQPYIGSNTQHMISVDVPENDPALLELLQAGPQRVPAK